jgi:hypothetical protein
MSEENFTQLMFVDGDGVTEDCGIIANKRDVGEYPVWLTYQRMEGEAEGLWWIIARCERRRRTIKLGYTEERRHVCWEAFARMTPADVEREMNTPDTPSA